MWLTRIYSGRGIFLLNAISFSCALVNSYLLNRYWTFAGESKKRKIVLQFFKFAAISVGGIIINSSIVYLGTTYFRPLFGILPVLWANLVKGLAVGASLLWNFFGYKKFVFRK